MRRPWIKIETCTPDKPEICSLATQLRMDEDTVVGKLVRLWSWAELNRIDPNDIGVTREFIDKLVGRKGFAQALEKTGWLIETNGKLSFRNFKRHNSPVAQNKALTAKRVARHRLRKTAGKEKVTTKPLAVAPAGALEVPKMASFVKPLEDVIIVENTLEISDPVFVQPEPEITAGVAIIEEPVIETPQAIEELETPPPAAPEPLPPAASEEAMEVIQAEDPAPRKRRGKAAVASDDQPLLF